MQKNIQHLWLIALFLLGFLAANGQAYPVETIKYSGPNQDKVNFLFLGDGSTASQMNQYISDVNNVTNQFFAQEPFSTLTNEYNVYAVKVPSNVTGAAMSPSYLIDNAFGSTYWYACLLYTSPSPRDQRGSRMPSSA